MKLICILFISTGIILSSCSTVSTGPAVSDLTASPIEPDWVQYTRAPIVSEAPDNNFIVTDEFVKKSAQQHSYIKKVQNWKNINSLP